MGALWRFAQALDEEPDSSSPGTRTATGADLSESDGKPTSTLWAQPASVVSVQATHRRENLDHHRGRPQRDDVSVAEDSGFSQSLSPLPVLVG